MLYLVDGYNVTKGDPATRAYSLERQRDALIARLRTRGGELLGPGRIVVFFDAAGGAGDSHTREGAVEVRFARAKTADDAIVALASGAGERVCLVSSDAVLRERVRTHAAHGAEMRSREVLFEASTPSRAPRRGRRYPASTVGLPGGANRITEELKRVWLDEADEGK